MAANVLQSINNGHAFVVWLIATGRYLYRRWRRSLAPGWPLVNGVIEHAEAGAAEDRFNVPRASVNLRYSYLVAGEWYGGEFTALFHDSNQALEFIFRAKGKPVKISANSADPAESTITPDQLEFLKAGLLADAGCSLRSPQHTAPVGVRLIAYLAMAIATVLFSIALCAHIAAIAGKPLLSYEQFVAAFVAGLAASFCVAILNAWMAKEERLGPSLPSPFTYIVWFFWAVSGMYVICSAFVPFVRGPLFNEQLACSILEFLCAYIFLSIYPALHVSKAWQSSSDTVCSR